MRAHEKLIAIKEMEEIITMNILLYLHQRRCDFNYLQCVLNQSFEKISLTHALFVLVKQIFQVPQSTMFRVNVKDTIKASSDSGFQRPCWAFYGHSARSLNSGILPPTPWTLKFVKSGAIALLQGDCPHPLSDQID